MFTSHAKVIIAILVIAAVSWGGLVWYQDHKACELRGRALVDRINAIRFAASRLKVGAPKAELERFFAEGHLPMSIVETSYMRKGSYEATSTVYVEGCSPFGCGADTALIGVRIPVDKTGMVVVGDAVVGSIYTNCL